MTLDLLSAAAAPARLNPVDLFIQADIIVQATMIVRLTSKNATSAMASFVPEMNGPGARAASRSGSSTGSRIRNISVRSSPTIPATA